MGCDPDPDGPRFAYAPARSRSSKKAEGRPTIAQSLCNSRIKRAGDCFVE
jgi:hypothetical protein